MQRGIEFRLVKTVSIFINIVVNDKNEFQSVLHVYQQFQIDIHESYMYMYVITVAMLVGDCKIAKIYVLVVDSRCMSLL